MGTLSKVRDNSQKIIWAFLITFILSMVAGGLMGGFNLVGQFKEWIGFNTSDQHAFSLDDERITHQSYVNTYDRYDRDDDVNINAHILALDIFKQRNATNELYEDVFNSNQVSDVDILATLSPEKLILQTEKEIIFLKQVPLKGYSEQFKDTNGNGLWDKQEFFVDRNENGKFNPEEFNKEYDTNKNGKWDDAEKFTDNKNGKWDEGEEFTDNKNGKWDEGEEFTDNLNFKYDKGEKFTDANKNGQYDAEEFKDANGNKIYDKGEEFTDTNENGQYDAEEFKDAGNGDKIWNNGEGFVDGNGKYDEGEKFVDAPNGEWDSNTQDWIDQSIKNGKIDYSVIEDPFFRQIVKSELSPTRQQYKLNKLNSVNASLNYKTNHEIQFADDLKNTEISIDYLKYDLSSIDDVAIKIDEQDLKSKITPFKKYNSGFSNVTLIIITLLFLIYSYVNRENRAKLSFGGFFFVAMFLITVFKFIDYNAQGSDSLRKISYVHITKRPGNDKYDLGEDFIDTNGNDKWDEGEKYTDTFNGEYDKGEEFTDENGNQQYDQGEEFVDAAGLDINKTKNEIVKRITEDGLNMKYLEDNDLKKVFYEDINIVKNFIIEDNTNNVNSAQERFLADILNNTFEVDLGSHFIIEDKSETDINGFIIGFVHSEENYYEYSEYEKLKNEFIKNEKQKMAESKLKDLVASAKDKDVLAEQIPLLFDEHINENGLEDFTSYDTVNGTINKVAETFGEKFTDSNENGQYDIFPEPEDFVDLNGNGAYDIHDPSVLGTLYAMKTGEASNVVFSNQGFAYVFYMKEKNTKESKIEYEAEREKQNSIRRPIVSNAYFTDVFGSLNVLDWRDEGSITVTVDPDTRATKNLSNLYFDYNSYLQLKNTLLNR